MDQGVLYLAKGQPLSPKLYARPGRRRQLCLSIRSPMLQIVSLTATASIRLSDKAPFEKRDRPQALQKTPYERTIYLDTDTYLAGSIKELFDLLDGVEFGVRRNRDQAHVPKGSPLPDSFPEFNTGVITYRSTESVMNMLGDWERRCCPTDEFDQRSLRAALYHSDVRFTCLPKRYNCMCRYDNMYRYDNVVDGEVKVFHGPLVKRERSRVDLQDAVSKLSSSNKVRLHYTWDDTLFVDPQPPLLTKVRSVIRRYGIRGLLARAAKKLARRLSAH